MATDPVPEPLTNQELREDNRTRLPTAQAPRLAADIAEMPPALPSVGSTTSETSSKIEEIRSRVSDVAEQAQQTVAETYDKAKNGAVRTYRQASDRASELVQTGRVRSRQIMHDYPFHVIAGAAVLGAVAGMLLRMWRSSRYE